MKETRTPAQIRLDIKRETILGRLPSLHKIMIAANVNSHLHSLAIDSLFFGIGSRDGNPEPWFFNTCYVQTPPKTDTGQKGHSYWHIDYEYWYKDFKEWHKHLPQPTEPLDVKSAIKILANESCVHDGNPQFLIPTAVFFVEDGSCPTVKREREQIRKAFLREAMKGTTPFILHYSPNSALASDFFHTCAAECMGGYAQYQYLYNRSDIVEFGKIIGTHALGLPSLLRNLDGRAETPHAQQMARQIIEHHGSLTL